MICTPFTGQTSKGGTYHQKELWQRYQKAFRYAQGLSFEETIETIETILSQLFHD